MNLRSLLAAIPGLTLPDHPALDQEVKGLSTNSHGVTAGDVFLGMPGTRVDGGEFWPSALGGGAIAAVISPQALAQRPLSLEDPAPNLNPCLIIAADMVAACAQIAAGFYGNPAAQLNLVGITGTNGKTTTTHLVEFWLNGLGVPAALFGTLYARWPGYQKTAAHTTPFAADLQEQLAGAVAAGCQAGVMEVSSHALEQRRVLGCPFEVAVFTNLTQDHLDYHPTMEDYFEAKALLFSEAYLKGRAVINRDDPYGQKLLDRLGHPSSRERAWSYSVAPDAATVSDPKVPDQADLWTSDLRYGPAGVSGIVHTPKGSGEFQLPLVGQFNLANFLGALGAGLHLGLDLGKMLEILPQFQGVPGRMERVQLSPDQEISVIVDYAHTPDSLENLLKASRPFIPGRMICVFGCGGDRDRTKRPLMGGIAARLADVVYVTSDNPRTEDPQKILADVLAGIPAEAHPVVTADRAEAIRRAILDAKPGDGVLIAGKGHEDYQILGTEKIHFDDREQAREALALRAG